VVTDDEADVLAARFTAAVEAHESHRAPYRRDPDGIWRCPQCEPEPPTPWVQLIPHVPRNPLARAWWASARAVVGWWERTVDAARERRRR
jgi:hypothetical protein